MTIAVAVPPISGTPKAKLPPLAKLPPVEKMRYFHASGLMWQDYAELADALEGRPGIRLTYDRGEMELMTISRRHGTLNSGLDVILLVLCEEFVLPSQAGSDMTFRREDLDRGFEPDDCYWIANLPKVIGRDELDFRFDPPPDLACEIDLSTSVMDRIGIYAALKVPEVWRYWNGTLRSGLLQPDGSYRWSDSSPLFPGIPLQGVCGYLEQSIQLDRLAFVAAFRAWVREQRAIVTP